MSNSVKLQTHVPETTRKRIWMYADREELSVSQWLARLAKVATMPGDVGQGIRRQVAETLAGTEKKC